MGHSAKALVFLEGTNWDLGIGQLLPNGERELLKHNFSLRSCKGNEGGSNYESIQGSIQLFFDSNFKLQDTIKSKSYSLTLSDIAKEIANTYNWNSIISTTANHGIFYQSAITDMEFLNIHRKIAFSNIYKRSPFLTFVSLTNDFYFAALEELMQNTNLVTPEFSLEKYENAFLSKSYITSFHLNYFGLELNLENYNKVVVYYAETDFEEGIVLDKYNSLKFSNDRQVAPDRLKDNVGTLSDINKNFSGIRRIENYGIVDRSEIPNFKGWENFKFINSLLSIRMTIQVPFNANAVSGKIIRLVTKHPIYKDSNSRFSTNWIIIASRHILMSGTETAYNIYTILDIARFSLPPSPINPLSGNIKERLSTN